VADEGRTYSDAELEAVLRRALEREVGSSEGFGHEELMAAAREVGLDERAVERAIEELASEREETRLRAGLRKRHVQRWLRHLVSYGAVVGGLLTLHALGLAGPWVLWVAVGWGVGLVLDTYAKLRAPSEAELARERRRANRKARRLAKAQAEREAHRRRAEAQASKQRRRAENAAQLERVIDEGVALLLGAARRKLSEAREEGERGGERRGNDFARYVAEQHARERGRSAPARGPRVRVDTRDAEGREEAVELERGGRGDRERRGR
jgi:hypothetical protein